MHHTDRRALPSWKIHIHRKSKHQELVQKRSGLGSNRWASHMSIRQSRCGTRCYSSCTHLRHGSSPCVHRMQPHSYIPEALDSTRIVVVEVHGVDPHNLDAETRPRLQGGRYSKWVRRDWRNTQCHSLGYASKLGKHSQPSR